MKIHETTLPPATRQRCSDSHGELRWSSNSKDCQHTINNYTRVILPQITRLKRLMLRIRADRANVVAFREAFCSSKLEEGNHPVTSR